VAQIVVVVLAPSMGDDIQTLKAGVLEVADLLVINKADLPGASDLEQNLEGLSAPVLRVSAHTNTGVDDLLRTILNQVRSKQIEG
jgi:LAO/AO transport system kinase